MDRNSDSSSYGRRWSKITNALQGLKGKNVSDRKQGVEKLTSILDDDDESLIEIDQNSMSVQSNNVMTWNNLFMEVEAFFMRETEKFQSTTLDQRKSAAFNLIHRIVTRANLNYPLLSMKRVYEFIITKLENKSYVECFGYNLIQMLQSFIAVKLYASTLTAENCSTLILVLIKLYNRHRDHLISKGLLLDSLNTLLLHGSNHPTVIPLLRTQVVSFYKSFEDQQRHNVPITHILKGIILLCQENAVEFRGILCRLGESLIPNLLANTSSSTIEDEETATIDLFLVQLKLHNPCDVSSSSSAFFAENIPKWDSTIRAMYSYCIETMEDLARKTTFTKGVKISHILLELAAKCTKQISNKTMNSEEPGSVDDLPPAKKHMPFRSFQSIIFDSAQQEPSQSQIVWLQYITAVLSNFPELVDTLSTVQSLFQLGLGLLNSTFVINEEIYTFFRSLLHCEKYLLKSKVLKERSSSWSHIWDITIKSLSINQAKPEALELLRTLLIEIQPLNINSLLLLYANNSLSLNDATVHLLLEYLSRCSLPQLVKISPTARANFSENAEVSETELRIDERLQSRHACPRITLTKWIINSPDFANHNHEVQAQRQISLVLISLIVKRSHILIQAEYPGWSNGDFRITVPFCIVHDDFEVALLRSCFEVVSNQHLKFKSTELPPLSKVNTDQGGTLNLLQNVADNLWDVLKDNYEISIRSDGKIVGDFMKKFAQVQARTAIILNMANILEKYNLGNSEFIRFRNNLDKLFEKVLNRYVIAAIEFLKSSKRNVDHIFLMVQTMRRMLCSGHLCDKLKQTLASKYPQQLQGLLRKIFRSSLPYFVEKNRVDGTDCIMTFDSGSHRDSFRSFHLPILELDEGALTETRLVELTSLEALRCLAEYGLICDHKTDLFVELLEDLTIEPERRTDKSKSFQFQLFNQFHFDLCVEVLSRAFRIITPNDKLLSMVVHVLQMMCRGFYSNPTCSKRLWDLFKELTPLIARETDDVNKKKFMILVGTLTTYLKNSGIKSSKSAFSMLSTLAKFDSYLTWSFYTRKADENNAWVLLQLQEYLNNPSHQFRDFAADAICSVFQCEGQFKNYSLDAIQNLQNEMNISTGKLKEFYLKVFETLRSAYDHPIGLTQDEMKEEAVNRTSLVLSCLGRIIFAFPLNQRKTLFSLLLVIKQKSISVRLAYRALASIHPEAVKTMIHHVSYVLKKWVKLEYSLNDLPYQLFDCDSVEDFLNTFKREITVQYFENNNIDALKLLASKLNLEFDALIHECYGTIMGRLAPGLAALIADKPVSPTKHLNIVSETHRRLVQLLGGKNKADSLTLNCLGDIILTMISLSHDPKIPEKLRYPLLLLPEPQSPFYSEEEIQIGLKFLQETCPTLGASILGYLVQNSPKRVYYILITLTRGVHNAHDQLEKICRLHHFSYFVSLLMNEPPRVFELMRMYLCQFVVHAYLRLLRSEEEMVVEAVILQLTVFIERLMTCSPEELMVHYRLIVNRLISVLSKYSDLSTCVAVPLDFLLKKYGVMFENCIVALDPFPTESELFQDYHAIQSEKKYGTRKNEWGLMKELKNCLNEVESANGACSKERLQFVKKLLSTKKSEFEGLIKELEGKKFRDECSLDIIHNLVQMLVRVIVHSRDEEKVLEACRCLGEIGPIDMAVLVLPSYGKKSDMTTMITAISSIIGTVAAYLLNDDIMLVLLAGEMLESLLEVTECVEFLKKDLCTLNPRLDSILTPFKCNKQTVKSPVRVVESVLQNKLGLNDLNEFIDYKAWIVQLTCGLIECMKPEKTIACRLLPLCKLRVDFCEYVLSFVVFVVLQGGRGNPLVRKHVSNYFRTFFSNFSTQHQNSSQPSRCVTPPFGEEGSPCSIYMNKLALRSLIRAVQFLRVHMIPQEFKGNVPVTQWDNNFWLDVSYLDLARAAQFCGAYLTSILFAEIYSFECLEDQSKQIQVEDECQFYSQETTSYPKNRNQAAEIEKLLLKAYSSIGESDAIYSCGSARFSDFQSNVQHLQQMQQWGRSLTAFDSVVAERSTEVGNSHVGICRSLKELGLCHVLWTYLEGVQGENAIPSDLSEIQYECGWRLSKWDLNSNKAAYLNGLPSLDALNGSATIQKFVYESIWFGLANDRIGHNESIRIGLSSIVRDLKHASLESSVNLYDFISQFQMFRAVEDFFKESESSSFAHLQSKWKLQDRFGYSDFKYQEPILHLRSVLLHSFGQKQNQIVNFDFDGAYDDCLLELLAKARDSARLEFAEKCASKIVSPLNEAKKELEIAKNCWARGDQDIARLVLGRVIKKRSEAGCDMYPSLLLLYGTWLSETKAERPNVILEKYLQRSCQLYENRRASISTAEIAKAHIVLAKYADAQYQVVANYMKSELFLEKINQFDRAREELKQNQGETTKDSDMKKSEAILRKQSSIDQEEIQALLEEKKKFLLLALRHYLRGLSYGNDHDLLIFRAFALWLENADQKEDIFLSASRIVAEEKLSSYKYLMVLHQLSARMGVSNVSTSVIINNILLKCAKEHPFHTLPVLLTQALLYKDKELSRANPKKHVEDRVKAAAKLVDMLKKDKEFNLGVFVQKMEKLWLSLIYLANVQETKNTENLRKAIPPNSPLRTLKNLEDVLVPTLSIPISAMLAYKDSVVGIKSFELVYEMVGGINSPKRISCWGTNGVKYNMLLKGQDDLRQDAVMQQVFGVMNKLLQAEPSSKARRLQIRTYKVVPLSQRSGILEWCENTQTFGDYLVGSGAGNEQGAHCLYRPMDYKPSECRKKMNEVKDCRDNAKKRTVFLNILEHFKPVFRHFFFEKFKDSGTFFERRLAYTRSVATSSMVGYILGLGDRHVLNILVDKNTAEFIHIDLGVAFEQGRILPTPETIPFRLTRDVVDGMGVSGVEGVFRRSCEMTLDVLRSNSEIILTILEVLLYDPLYIWTVTADRVQKVQPSGITETSVTRKSLSLITGENNEDAPKERNNSAARVLLRLKQKLMGIEEGGSSGSSLSVTGHVSLLIQTALDTDRHSKLFPGWQPYL